MRDEEDVARVGVCSDFVGDIEEADALEVAEDPAVVVDAEGEEREGRRRAEFAREERLRPVEIDAAAVGGIAVVVVTQYVPVTWDLT